MFVVAQTGQCTIHLQAVAQEGANTGSPCNHEKAHLDYNQKRLRPPSGGCPGGGGSGLWPECLQHCQHQAALPVHAETAKLNCSIHLQAVAQAAAGAVGGQHAPRRHGQGQRGGGGARRQAVVGQAATCGSHGKNGQRLHCAEDVKRRRRAWSGCCWSGCRLRLQERRKELTWQAKHGIAKHIAANNTRACIQHTMPHSAAGCCRRCWGCCHHCRCCCRRRYAACHEYTSSPTVQHVYSQGGPSQPHQPQLQALARVAVQGVGVGRALRGREEEAGRSI